MEESNVNNYSWREPTEQEYARYEKQNMLFYRVADIIITFLLLGIIIMVLLGIIKLTSGLEIKTIIEVIFLCVAAVALLFGRARIRKMGLSDIKEKNLCACTGTYVRLEEEARSRNGDTRYDYYAIVQMPDNKYLKIETTLGEVEKLQEGELVTVIRPIEVVIAQRMDILT